jgi:hypothetical protein
MHQINKKIMIVSDSDSDKIEQFSKITVMLSLNESLQSIGESPIKKDKRQEIGKGEYCTSKMKRIEKAVKTRILNVPENVNLGAVSPSTDAEILKQ